MARPENKRDLEQLRDDVRAALRRWTDHDAADPGLTLVELFAYLAESLSRYADALAAESYLGSARRAPEVQVEIDGERWERRPSLDRSGPDDRHFTLGDTEDGTATILFGDGEHGRRPPTGARTSVTYRSGSRYASVHMQEGRVVIDADWTDRSVGKACGIYRAVVVDATDPTGAGRLLVQLPGITGAASMWAMPCYPPAALPTAVPQAVSTVWVLFEEGDLERPVWLGSLSQQP